MKKAIINLLKVKTIISFVVIGIISYLAVIGSIESESYMVIASAIITYYFTRKEEK